jgi:unsaturated rhamnogalacturonyl hydrolase
MNPYLNKTIDVITHHIKHISPKMKWMWGEALFGYSLLCLDNHLKQTTYKTFIESYLDYYLAHPPVIDQSDTFAPILISYTYDLMYETDKYHALTQKGLNYFNHAKPVIDFLPNHLGHSLVSKLYPDSIWVDSLMMYGVFLSLYGYHQQDHTYTTLAYQTVLKFHEYLEQDGLWTHAYLTKSKKAYPKNIFWGRGNGWVLTSLPIIYHHLNKDQQKNILPIYKKTVQTIETYQKDGLYETILNVKSIKESSCNFLIYGGILHGISLGMIPQTHEKLSLAGYEKAMDTFIKDKKGNPVLTKVSNPTIPMPLIPKLGYKYIGTKDNWSYGLASLVFASIEYDIFMKKK